MNISTIGLGLTLALSPMAALAQSAPSMALGSPAPPPAGYLDLCQRAPEQCVETQDASPQQLAAVSLWAAQTRWASVFQPMLSASAAVSARRNVQEGLASVVTVSGDQATGSTRVGDDRARMKLRRKTASKIAATVSHGAETSAAEHLRVKREIAKAQRLVSVASRRPRADLPLGVDRPQLPTATSAVASDMTLLNAVNRQANRDIRRASDQAVFGREEYWNVPSGRRPTGDCEDYVLAKRQALIRAGVPNAALSIAVVRTRRQEMHAVLLVATPQGEVVMDNLSPWIVPWSQAPYQWLQRQVPGSTQAWVFPAGI